MKKKITIIQVPLLLSLLLSVAVLIGCLLTIQKMNKDYTEYKNALPTMTSALQDAENYLHQVQDYLAFLRFSRLTGGDVQIISRSGGESGDPPYSISYVLTVDGKLRHGDCYITMEEVQCHLAPIPR